MEIRIENDETVHISGYVNAIERNSKPLWSRMGRFIERIAAGAFKNALKRSDDVHILLNHDWKRDLGSVKAGNLTLTEDNIGLKADAVINDREIVKKAQNGDLIGWSFGFSDRNVENTTEHDMPVRIVRDLDLYEVSILDRQKRPAYAGTLLSVRDDSGDMIFRSAEFSDQEAEKSVENVAEPEKKEEISYKSAEEILDEIREVLK